MCGIVGVLRYDGRPVDGLALARMRDTLAHRGPDGAGLVLPEPCVGLAHRRLAILGVENGAQPIANEDESVWVTGNGEIFNYRELRRELEGRGHRFRTATDTEVIVHLYEEEGPACVRRLEGQFAFALWDGERLLCARDGLGIKPIYTYRDGRRFAFASEPRAFLQLPGFEPEIDLCGIDLYMRYRFIPAPASAFRGVRKLRPGEWLTVDRKGYEQRGRFFALEPARCEVLSDPREASTRLRGELAAAVRRQLVSDVPVGAFLSGGLDSSAVAALMATTRPDSIRTFSIGFEEQAYDERRFARAVARKSVTDHAEETFTPVVAREVMTAVLDHVDEPFGDASILPTYAVSRLARQSVTVALSGDGGDELFAGYGRYFRALQLLAIHPTLRPLHRFIRHVRRPPRDASRWRHPDHPAVDAVYHESLKRVDERDLHRLYGPRLRALEGAETPDPVLDVMARARGLPPLSRLLATDLHSILSEYHLVKMDRASMQNSLEVRVPLLDRRVVELAFLMSPAVRLHGGRSKGILRTACADLLPPGVLRRPKTGFSVPLKYWFAGPLAGFARDRLENARVVSEGLLDGRALDRLLRPVRGKVNGARIWRVLVLEAWLRGLRNGGLARLSRGVAAPVTAPAAATARTRRASPR